MSTQRRGSGGGKKAAGDNYEREPYDANKRPRRQDPLASPVKASVRRQKGKIFYDCLHTYDSEGQQHLYSASIPNIDGQWQVDKSDGTTNHKRVHSKCVVCDLVDMIYVPARRIYTDKDDNESSYETRIKQNRLETPHRDARAPFNERGTMEIQALEATLQQQLEQSEFFRKWRARVSKIHHFKGESGEVPVIKWKDSFKDSQRAVLRYRLEVTGMGDWAPYALTSCVRKSTDPPALNQWWPGMRSDMNFETFNFVEHEANPLDWRQYQEWSESEGGEGTAS